MRALTCPAATLCAATSSSDEIVATHVPRTPKHWSESAIADAENINSVSCAVHATLCVAGDSNGDLDIASNPLGGARAWRTTHADPETVSCDGGESGVNACQAMIGAVSCPSHRFCLAADDAGNVLTNTQPASAVSVWRIAKIAAAAPDPSVGGSYDLASCPTRSFCAVIETTSGELLTSTDPAGGATKWQHILLHDAHFTAIACASSRLCVLTDDEGNVFTSTDPSSGRATWTRQHIDRPSREGSNGLITHSLTGISCPSASECVAVDGFGRVLIGRA